MVSFIEQTEISKILKLYVLYPKTPSQRVQGARYNHKECYFCNKYKSKKQLTR